jgi:ornithine cyclodeaminase
VTGVTTFGYTSSRPSTILFDKPLHSPYNSPMPLHILTASDVQAALPMPAAIDAMRKAFSLVSSGAADIPLRTRIDVPNHDATTLVMPAYLHVGNRLGVKIVSLFPNNPDLDLPMLHAVVILINAATGQPEALLEGAALTAIRTGAACGLATDLLARPEASSLAIIGSGPQARAQLEAVCCVRLIQRIRVYSPTRAHAEQFAQDMAVHGSIEVSASASQATAEADIICTATSSTTPVIDAADVRPGAHINAVGSHTPAMREISPELVRQSLVVVDQRQAALSESGEVMACIADGSLTEWALVEVGEIVNHRHAGRANPDQITLFKTVGIAAQDIAAAQQALLTARQKKLGFSFEL